MDPTSRLLSNVQNRETSDLLRRLTQALTMHAPSRQKHVQNKIYCYILTHFDPTLGKMAAIWNIQPFVYFAAIYSLLISCLFGLKNVDKPVVKKLCAHASLVDDLETDKPAYLENNSSRG